MNQSLTESLRVRLADKLADSLVAEFERRRASVTYVRTAEGREVDFLARHPGGGMELIQVCADATAAGTLERELRALDEAGRRYPDATRVLLTLTGDAIPPTVPKEVVAQPAYEWMLR